VGASQKQPLGRLLVEAGLVTETELEAVLARQRSDPRRLGELLVEAHVVSSTQVTQLLSHQLRLPWINPEHVYFDEDVIALVPRELAARYCLIPVYVRRDTLGGRALYIATDDPLDEDALRACGETTGMAIFPMVATTEQIRRAIRRHYDGAEPSSPLNVGEDELADARGAMRVAASRPGSERPSRELTQGGVRFSMRPTLPGPLAAQKPPPAPAPPPRFLGAGSQSLAPQSSRYNARDIASATETLGGNATRNPKGVRIGGLSSGGRAGANPARAPERARTSSEDAGGNPRRTGANAPGARTGANPPVPTYKAGAQPAGSPGDTGGNAPVVARTGGNAPVVARTGANAPVHVAEGASTNNARATVLVAHAPKKLLELCEVVARSLPARVAHAQLAELIDRARELRPIAIVVTEDVYAFDRLAFNRLAYEVAAPLVLWNDDLSVDYLEPLLATAYETAIARRT
jgi:hypothetical protein